MIVDRMADYIVAKGNTGVLISDMFPEYDPISGGNIHCPWHEDKDPSLHIDPVTGAAYCHGRCGKIAMNVVALYAKVHQVEYTKAREMLYDQIVNAIPNTLVGAYRKALRKNAKALEYIRGRGVQDIMIETFDLGWDPDMKRITMPVYDSFDRCVNIRKYSFDPKSEYKILNVEGHGGVRLFNEPTLTSTKHVLITEGEWDCIIATQIGVPAVSWTGGAGKFNPAYFRLLAGKQVFILYDRDESGAEGAKKLENALRESGLCPWVEVIRNTSGASGKDINDWYNMYPYNFGPWLMEQTRPRSLKLVESRHVCPTCGQEVKS